MGSDEAISTYHLAESALAWINEFYARMFRDWPGAVTRDDEGYTLSFSGDVHLSGANHIWPHGMNSLTQQAIQEAAAFFAAYEAAWSVICVQPYMETTLRQLVDQAFKIRWDAALMVLDGADPCPPPHDEVRLVLATSTHHLRDLTAVLSEAFASGPSVNRRVVRREHLDDPTIRHYILYRGLHPVSAATVMIHAECSSAAQHRMASVWNVGTRPRFRRRGYAALLMSGLLADLRGQGVTTTMLLASPSGYKLYRQLGFCEIGTVAYLGPPYDRC